MQGKCNPLAEVRVGESKIIIKKIKRRVRPKKRLESN